MKKSILIFVILFGLVACSQKPVFTFEVLTPASAASATPWVAGTETAMALASPTPWVGGTETALAAASPTPWVAGTQTALAASSAIPFPDVTQEIIERPTDFSPVLYGGKVYDTTFFLLLGGVSRDSWMTPETSVARFSSEVTYSLHSLTQQAKYFVWGRTPELSPTCQTYSIGTDAMLDEPGFVGVVDIWPVSKRDVTELSGELYQQAVLDWLTATEGVEEAEIGTLQVIRVDLEGDGTDEIFISATRLDGQITKAGDYSIVLMRKVIGNDIVTKLVAGEVYQSKDAELTFPRTYSLANFIDLNQDGVLEVVVGYLKWEGFGARVYQANGQDLNQVLQAGCGL